MPPNANALKAAVNVATAANMGRSAVAGAVSGATGAVSGATGGGKGPPGGGKGTGGGGGKGGERSREGENRESKSISNNFYDFPNFLMRKKQKTQIY